MKNIIIITKREFITQVKKKSFVILTILAPLLLVGFGVLIGLMFKANETAYTFNVIDKTGWFKKELKSTENIKYVFLSEENEMAIKSSLKEMQGIDGLLIIPKFENEDFNQLEEKIQFLVNKKIGLDTKKNISNNLEKIIRTKKINQLGIEESQIKSIDKSFTLNTTNVAEQNKQDNDLDFSVKYTLSMILAYIIFTFIMIYGVRVMRSVLEEKNNRVVEVIISSVKPFELMLGKILGVTFVAITQFLVWITMSISAAIFFNAKYFFPMKQNISENANNPSTEDINIQQIIAEISHSLLELNVPLIIFVFIAFFFLGYIFYSSMYAAIGSAVDNETETQQFTLFAILPLLLGIYGSMTIINNPEGPLAFWLSIIPFTSPVAMMARAPFGVPFWELVLSLSILIITTSLMIFIASKIYRVGILMYGNKASLKEIWKWIKN